MADIISQKSADSHESLSVCLGLFIHDKAEWCWWYYDSCDVSTPKCLKIIHCIIIQRGKCGNSEVAYLMLKSVYWVCKSSMVELVRKGLSFKYSIYKQEESWAKVTCLNSNCKVQKERITVPTQAMWDLANDKKLPKWIIFLLWWLPARVQRVCWSTMLNWTFGHVLTEVEVKILLCIRKGLIFTPLK